MNKLRSIHPKVPNFAFFGNWHRHHSSRSQDPSPNQISQTSPTKTKNEPSSETSFDKINFGVQDPHGTVSPLKNPDCFPLISLNLTKSKISTNSKRITLESNVSSPNISRTPTRLSRRLENDVENANYDQNEQNSNKTERMMRQIPLIEMNVSDIRRRMRNYHPINSVEQSSKDQEMNFTELSRQVMQELKRDKETQKLTAQLKWIRHQNIDKLFEEIREESDKNIQEAIEKLKVIKKEDNLFHEKVTQELEELKFLKKELLLGFENICLKGTIDPKNYIKKKLAAKLYKNCRKCGADGENKDNKFVYSHSPLSARVSFFRETIKTDEYQRSPSVFEIRHKTLKGIPRSDHGKKKLPTSGIFRARSVRRLRSVDQNYRTGEIPRRIKISYSDQKNNKQTDLFKNQINNVKSCNEIPQSEPVEGLEHYQRGNSLSNHFSNFPPSQDENRAFESNKVKEASQLKPNKFYIKLTKHPFSPDNFLLNFFTSPNSKFETEIKLNDTIEVDFIKNQLKTNSEDSHFPSENTIFQFQSPTKKDKGNSNVKVEFQNLEVGSQDQRLLSELGDECQECLLKLEGITFGLQHFQEIDEKAISLEAYNMEALLSKLIKTNQAKDHFDHLLLKNSLKEACKNVEAFLESCFDIAPIHVMKLEKLFKIIIFFFELKIRRDIQSQKELLNEIEEGKLFLKHKKKLFEQLNKLEEENARLLEDLKISQHNAKEDKKKYKEHVRLLLMKIEELRYSCNLLQNQDILSN